MRCYLPLAAAVTFVLFVTCSADGHGMELECPEGWIMGYNKCYKVFSGNNKRTYTRAREMCENYGSRLVMIKDQLENDLIGEKVKEATGIDESYYIGLSKEKTDDCDTCTELRWSNGEEATEYQGFWADNEPEDSDGGCVFSMKNREDYVYDRPYTWSYCNCLVIRSFVCEKMAAPEDTFHCFGGGYINKANVCNGNSDCADNSDELNCPNMCRYYHEGESGALGTLMYGDAMTCTWAIVTPPGTNAYVQLNNFNTEYQADVLTIYSGSTSETKAMVVDRISGDIGSRSYRSYNNFLFLKFSSDASVSNTGLMTGFSGTFGSLKANTDLQVNLIATATPKDYSLSTFDVANTNDFLGQRDYVFVIETENRYQFGQMITLEILDLKINEGDTVMFFDGGSNDKVLASNCNDDDDCDNYKLVYSTGKKLSILLRTHKTVSNNVVFKFRYRQGCYYETTDPWGTIFTPGFTGKINYPNFVKCTWKIMVNEPIALYFDSESRLQSADYNRIVNGDFLKIYDDDSMIGSLEHGLSSSDIVGKVFTLSSGSYMLEFESSVTRSARGFLATWSTACVNPNYDENTIVNPTPGAWHYRSTITLTCKSGYDFHQEQIPANTPSVTIECGFKGIWKNYLQIPRCTPKYCGDVPNIDNGYIVSSTGTVFGSKATYKCNTGSALSAGSLEISCRSDGLWEFRPTCSAARCPANQIAMAITNGQGQRTFGDGTSIGTIYEFECDAGFEIVGEPYIICKDDGSWSQARAPSCKRLRCLLPDIKNGNRFGSDFLDAGSTATATCSIGYEFAQNSPRSINCSNDRVLSQQPQCVDVDECLVPGRCAQDCSNNDGSYTCSCSDGYRLNNDQFSCGNIDECAENTHNCDGLCTDTLGSYTCSCNRPYVLYTADMTSGYSIPTNAGERGDLPTDTFHINHSCVLITCEQPDQTVENGQLLTKRSYHRYGDSVEYQCNIGYTPLRTILTCDRNGIWNGVAPTCSAAQCATENIGLVQTRPTYTNGPYDFGQQLTLECDVAGRKFNKYRYCTYNKETDTYEMQGSTYDCGVVDCGTPKQEPGSNYGVVLNTFFGNTFEFTCGANTRKGQTNAGSSSTVGCLKEGYWDFGNLQCTAKSCSDPGHPAGGEIIATSFADKSTVKFRCIRNGYTLTNDVTLTCQGTNFFSGGETIPQCIDTEKPVITNCLTDPIVIRKYEHLRPRLPQLTVADNTGVRSFTIEPRNANTTLYVSNNLNVVYTVTDYANNQQTCTVQVILEDEEPPTVTCPLDRFVYLEDASSTVQYTRLTVEEVVPFNQRDSIKNFQVTGQPDILSASDVYRTYTYSVLVTDAADNSATCKGQIFVRPKACSELSFPTPVYADKVCTSITNGLRCTLTCQDAYTFDDGKAKTVQCIGETWDTDWIPACVRDQTKPVVRCPQSLEISQLSKSDDTHTVDFTSLRNSVTITDFNTYNEPVFSPETYTFRENDLYKPVEITVSVTDNASNTGFCRFQYTAVPPVCSQLSLPKTLFASVVGTRRQGTFLRSAGWDVDITCDTGKILRNVGASTTISCDDGQSWLDNNIFPTCIDDNKPPVLVCPQSRPERISTGNDVRDITFENNANYGYTVTDYSPVKSTVFSPQTLQLNQDNLNSAQTITLTATDNADNVASCSFEVLVAAETCSPLTLPAPINGVKNCSPISNGYSCIVSCNANYHFYGTTSQQITTTCQTNVNNGEFSQYIPDCARDDDVNDKQFIAKLSYQYVPADDTVNSVPESCITYYRDMLSQSNTGNSVFDQMTSKLLTSCDVVYGPFPNLKLSFLPANTEGSVNSQRQVNMIFAYTMIYPQDPTVYDTCTDSFDGDIGKAGNTLALSENIPGSSECPELKWNNIAFVSDKGSFCVAPFYESQTDVNKCVRCPAGTQSNGVQCSVCPLGTYRTYVETSCSSCPTGYTTRYPGATSSGLCVAPCGAGQVSTTGYTPCNSCPVGSYKISNTQCQQCGNGETTVNRGSSSSDFCVASSSINDEPCTPGTQDIGNNQCELCSVGTYRSQNTQTCISCPNSGTSTYTLGSVSSSQCLAKCSPGYTSTTGLAPCVPCPKGQYAVNTTTCIQCPTDYTTITDGATSTGCVELSSLRLRCSRGTSRNVNTDSCDKCAEGTYSFNEEGSCISCDGDETTFFSGATASTMCRSKCPPGFYSQSGKAPCTPCGVGKYSSTFGSQACTSCSLNNDMITATTTAISSSECIAKCDEGYFSYSGYNENNACRQCPIHHYQSLTGSTGCIPCGPSSFTTSPGTTLSSQCLSFSNQCDNYCENGGNCVTEDNMSVCKCTPGQYYGQTCRFPVNHCASSPCYNNGFCTNLAATFQCDCRGVATGDRCETIIKKCDPPSGATCLNEGHCVNMLNGTRCLCAEGYTESNNCADQRDICVTNPCSQPGTLECRDVSLGNDLRRFCVCRSGYTGETCNEDVDECASNPCVNGATCRNLQNAFRCDCPTGYSGTYCEVRTNTCSRINCRQRDTTATCVDVHSRDQPTCICNPGFSYDDDGYAQYQISLNMAPSNLQTFTAATPNTAAGCRESCTSQGTSCDRFAFDTVNNNCYVWNSFAQLDIILSNGVNMYTKTVIHPDDDFYTPRYNLRTPSLTSQSDQELLSTLNSYGLNICAGTVPLSTRCCKVGETCLDNENLPPGVCTANGLNFPNTIQDYDVQFKCSVNRVFQNNVCSQKLDYCNSDPCVNSVRCTSIFGGYTCTCSAGYTGKNCQTNIDECANNPCRNGGTCEDLVNGFNCKCTDTFEGPTCANPKNFCNFDSCNRQGTCTTIIGVSYKCSCYNGYTGTDCETETDFCESNPCLHGGTCQGRLGGYTCNCVEGWQGINCETVVEQCDLATGRQCLGDCYNIFNGYSCKCAANTFGTNCQNQPNPCRDYNKCQNNAQCSYNGTMNCACPAKYTDDGCHILIDYCGKTNPCENGAMCSVTNTGYQCTCKPGYGGLRCEQEINECEVNNVRCPGGGRCLDALNKYYCRCPIRKTGTNCQKVADVNYDLYFNHPQGRGYAWIPYPVEVERANFMSVSLWVRYSMNDGTGVYMTQFLGQSLEDADRFMEFEEKGVKVYVQTGTSNYIQLEYDRTATVNNGHWHLVTVLCDMVKGEAQLMLNTVLHDTKTNSGLVMPAANFSMWVVLGCEFDNEEHRCSESGSGFHGYLSQVNWYKRKLSFEYVDQIEGDIPKIYRLPQHVFYDAIREDENILVWNEYVYESGVSRMTPSEAKGDLCSKLLRNPPCSSYTQATLLPSVTGCPEDIVIYSNDRVVSVPWVEPVFLNLGSQGKVFKPDRLPGSSFSWGVYRNTYIGVDGGNNKAYCHFTVYVNAGNCDSPPDPFRGTQTCNNVSGRKGCMTSCNSQSPNMYMTDRIEPELYTCGPSGWWNQDKPFRKFRYPSCGLIKATPRVKPYIRLSYRVVTAADDAVKRNMRTRTYEEFRTMNNNFQGNLCQNADCSDMIVEITINSVNKRRRRRQTESVRNVLLEITLPSVDARTTLDGEDITSEEFLIYHLLGLQVLKFDTIPGLQFLEDNFEILLTEICPAGEVLLNGQCIECGPGNYFRYTDSSNTTAVCDDCPLGSYQDEDHATSCKPCGSGLTTEMTGEYQQNQCKKSCPIGEYFSTILNNCAKCAIGFYQDEVGQFRCKGCQAGYITKDEGSVSSTQCSVSCDSGYELNSDGNCVACKIGQFRDATVSQNCQPCTPGYITANAASRAATDCNIVACTAGNYRNATLNECKPCPLNYYQEREWQTSCESCGDPARWRTETEGTVLQSQCKYYCPSGYQVKQDPTYGCEICEIGTYKDNTVDIQGMCTTCPGNRRSENAGAKSALECTIYKCPVGNRPNTANTACIKCPLGEYQDKQYSKDCKKCDDGYSTRQIESTSETNCERYCESGSEKINGLCKPCNRGYYKDNANGVFELCKPCNSIYTTNGTGSTTSADCNIRTCAPGTKRNSDDSGCVPCPRGTYQPDAFKKDCLPCDSGTFTRSVNSTARTDCENYCDSGYEKTNVGCVGCEIGYYKDNNEDYFATCTLCPIDYITENKNTVSKSLCNVGNCSAGQYLQPDKTCALCPKGEYQPLKWQSGCMECGTDKTTENQGSDDLSDCILVCNPGYEDIGGSCQECPRGYYKIEFAAAKCKPCLGGTTTETTGATNPGLCTLPACTAGQYLDRDTSPSSPICRSCAYDTYQDEIWQEQCKPCRDLKVTLSMKADEESDCVLDCASGTEYDSNSGQCEFCPVGYYRKKEDRQQPQCQLCPVDKLTNSEGGKDVSECVIANCTTPGFYRETTTNTCNKCPIGTYNSQKWVTSCTNCPLGNSTKFTGATTIMDCRSVCPLGQYVGTSNKCELCAVGTYRSDMAADTCTPCQNGLLTPQTGAQSDTECTVSPCAAGQRYELNNQRCVDCEIGTYQPNAGSFQCVDCPFAIKYTPRTGATSEDLCRSPCNAGQQFNAGSSTCVPCPSGTFQPEAFQYTCMQCPAGRKFTTTSGSKKIEDCLSYCSAAAANDCSANATCSVSDTNSLGYSCTCFTNYQSVGQITGRECVHKCDLGYCKNGATCTREPRPRCTCSKWYKGDLCETRVKAEELADDTLDIVIPVSIAAGGLILFLIILAVCCLCWRSRGKAVNGPQTQYSEFHGERIDKASLHSYPIEYTVPYGSRPPSRLMMLAPGPDIVYENPAYSKDQSAAVYEA